MLQQHLPLAVLKQIRPRQTMEQKQLQLQQHLPLAVLKPNTLMYSHNIRAKVATALTACGIETIFLQVSFKLSKTVATALTACGIET